MCIWFLDVTGSTDGSVSLWEWGNNTPVCTPRPPGTYAKVNRLKFSEHGNKFGVGDSDGKFQLWQLNMGSPVNRSYFVSILFFICQKSGC